MHPKRYLEVFGYWWPKFLGSKNRFFSIFPKCVLNCSYWWILLKNVFWRVSGPVSDSFRVVIVVWSPCVKIQNFQKKCDFCVFCDFLMLVVLDSKKHKNHEKFEIFQKHVLYFPKMLPDTEDCIFWWAHQLLSEIQNYRKMSFLTSICAVLLQNRRIVWILILFNVP